MSARFPAGRSLAMGLVGLAWAAAAHAQIPQPDDAPQPLTPEQTASSYRLPEGFRLEVIASEPLIASPSGVCWDEQGRMFVTELHGYNLAGQLDIEELNRTGQLDTQVRRVQAEERFKQAALRGTYGAVKLLRDTNGDGRMDAAAVWATNLPPAYGLVPARGGVIVACAPDIVFLADRDGDGQAEVRETLFTGFPTGELERGINGPQWGADGWIYFGRGWGGGEISGPRLSEPVKLPGSDFRIRADGSAIEPVSGSTHTFGFAFTAAGDRFVATTSVPGVFIAPLPWNYLARNPEAAGPALEVPTGDRRAYSVSKPHPWRQKRADDPAYFQFYRSRYGPSESEADGWFTSACGPLIYQDHVLPGLHGSYFVCEPAGNFIHRAELVPDGTAIQLRRLRDNARSEFAASTDAWSHPMFLAHGPDGAIWVVDYYREIIEDYSAIPRHLQQQYGLYAGHDRGRIYRLTHRDAVKTEDANLNRLDNLSLANECASPLGWRRQTAQRLLVERDAKQVAPQLRASLASPAVSPAAAITVARTLDQLNALTAADVAPLLRHADLAVRVHAWQLADRRFPAPEHRDLLDAALTAAQTETEPRALLQIALSLGESRDPRAFAQLVKLSRTRLELRWMDAAIMSSVRGRELALLADLLGDPGSSAALLEPLAQAIAARREPSAMAAALQLALPQNAEVQARVLAGLTRGRKNAPRAPIADASLRSALTALAASADPRIREAAQSLEATFVAATEEDSGAPVSLATAESVSEERFRQYVAALSIARDSARGHEVFLQACAPCHRVGSAGSDLGPDLMSQIGIAEESLLREILLPSERIRPGYETVQVRARDGSVQAGILKDDGATSLTLAQANGAQQVLLRKDLAEVQRIPASLMPSFAETLTPADVAHLLAWLRSRRGAPPGE